MGWDRVVVVGLVVVSLGCGAPRVCVPGKSEACVGPGGCAGGQRCADDGSAFGVCECASPSGGGGGSTGGGGGAGGGGGGGLGDGGAGDDGGSPGDAGPGDAGGMTDDAGTDGGDAGDGGQPDAGLDAGPPPPELELLPGTTLDLGTIAWFPSAQPRIAAVTTLTVRNAGPLASRLLLGQADAGSQPPYWSVTALGAASASEVCVGRFDVATNQCDGTLPSSGFGSYSPASGLAGTEAIDLPVRIAPEGLGVRSFELRFFTNDPDEPVTTVTLTVTAISAPLCNATVSPGALDFGSLGDGAQQELAIAIRNVSPAGGPNCLVMSPTIEDELGRPASLPPVFSLPAVPRTFEVRPGETRLLPVRAAVRGPVTATPVAVAAKLRFFLADAVAPLRELDLSASLASTCLLVTPGAHAFGAWGLSCAAPARTFQVTNLCAQDVTITSTSMPLAGSALPGTPACPGAAPCPEFEVTAGLDGGTLVTPGGSPPTFAVRYRPLDPGADTGAFSLATTESGQARRYVVGLRGEQEATGLNEETFTRGPARADVLLVIDDSCSMGDKQLQLANNMAALLQHATLNQVDYQVGVTNTELSGSTALKAGLLHTSPGGFKILRPATPNLALEYAGLVRVGTSGYSESCLVPATRGLTRPYTVDPAKNLGFLRDDATLGVVCVTDARDQSVGHLSLYLNQLIHAKGPWSNDLLTYSVMGPFLPSSPAGCSYDDPNDGRHDELVTATSGAKEEICTADWTQALQRIGEIAFGARRARSFSLTARPDPMAPLTVTINGQAVPEVSPTPPNTRYWRWDATTNRVVFEAFAQPQPGATVVVRYTTACVP